MGCSFSGLNALYDAVNGSGDVWINENRFKILRQLGEGGFAYVYLVKEHVSSDGTSPGLAAKKIKNPSHISEDGTYAMKKVVIQSEEQLALVKEEIHVSSLFSHVNLLPLLDHAIIAVKGTQGARKHEAYLLFPVHLDGTLFDNAKVMQAKKEFYPTLTVLQIFRQLCAGLQHMHNFDPPYAHNDVKPGNVLITNRKGQPPLAILMDFGSARPAKKEIRSRSEALQLQTQKDSARIVANLQRQHVHSWLIASDYLEADKDLMYILISGCQSICLILWGDVADLEGKAIEDAHNANPLGCIVAIFNAKGNMNRGENALCSTTKTAVEINPEIAEAVNLKTWMATLIDSDGRDKFFSIKRKEITDFDDYSLADILDSRTLESKKPFIAVTATINDIINRDMPWYEACLACNCKVDILDGDAHCGRCKNNTAEYKYIYLLKLSVTSDTRLAKITLFNGAESIIGCSVDDFVKSKNEKKYDCPFYRHMTLQKQKHFRFYIRTAKITDDTIAKAAFVAENAAALEDEDLNGKRIKI